MEYLHWIMDEIWVICDFSLQVKYVFQDGAVFSAAVLDMSEAQNPIFSWEDHGKIMGKRVEYKYIYTKSPINGGLNGKIMAQNSRFLLAMNGIYHDFFLRNVDSFTRKRLDQPWNLGDFGWYQPA